MIQPLGTLLTVVCTVVTLNFAMADVVTLTDGQRVSGKIITEGQDEIVIEVQVSESIVDQKTISRDEIDSIEKETNDARAFREIAAVEPGPNSLSSRTYEIILVRLRAFQTQYPDSSHKSSVAEKMRKFEEEKARVDAGEIKLDHDWLTKEEVDAQKVEIGGKLMYAAMQEAARRRDVLSALNTFEALQKQYAGAKVYPDAVDLARQLVNRLGQELPVKLSNAQRHLKEWQVGYDISPVDLQMQLTAAREQEQKQIAAAIARAEQEGVRWTPMFERSEDSIVRLQKVVETESKRLAAIDTAQMRAGIASAEAAAKALEKKDFDEATRLTAESKAAWPAGDAAAKLDAEISKQKAAAEAAAKAAAEAAAKLEADIKAGILPAATPIPAPPTPAPEPAVESSPTASAPQTPSAAEAVPPVNAATPKPAKSPASKAEPKAKNFFLTLPGAVSILVGIMVILGLASVLGKPRKPAPPVEE